MARTTAELSRSRSDERKLSGRSIKLSRGLTHIGVTLAKLVYPADDKTVRKTNLDNTVFYSWQSDLPRKYTRGLIHDAAAEAVDRMAGDTRVEDSPRLDQDTQDISGAPEIATTIFSKIDKCSYFLADVSFIGETVSDDTNKRKKKLSNPNVLMELGYAAAKIGWHRIILVMNTKHGGPEELNFDLVHRRFPIRFGLGPENKQDLEKVQAQLSQDIEGALRTAARTEHEAVQEAISSLDVNCLRLMSGFGQLLYFSSPSQSSMGEIVSHGWFFAAVPRLLTSDCSTQTFILLVKLGLIIGPD